MNKHVLKLVINLIGKDQIKILADQVFERLRKEREDFAFEPGETDVISFQYVSESGEICNALGTINKENHIIRVINPQSVSQLIDKYTKEL